MASEQSFAFGRKPPSTPISGLIFEAEKALLRVPPSSNGGYLGSGYADFGTKRGNSSSGRSLSKRRSTARFGMPARTNDLLLLNVEGQITASHTLLSDTGGLDQLGHAGSSLHFTPGIHTIRLTAIGNAGPNLDRLEVTSMDQINKSSPSPKPPPCSPSMTSGTCLPCP